MTAKTYAVCVPSRLLEGLLRLLRFQVGRFLQEGAGHTATTYRATTWCRVHSQSKGLARYLTHTLEPTSPDYSNTERATTVANTTDRMHS